MLETGIFSGADAIYINIDAEFTSSSFLAHSILLIDLLGVILRAAAKEV